MGPSGVKWGMVLIVLKSSGQADFRSVNNLLLTIDGTLLASLSFNRNIRNYLSFQDALPIYCYKYKYDIKTLTSISFTNQLKIAIKYLS